MTLIELLLATSNLMSREQKEQGLVLLARLGRYAHEDEREAAFLLPALRAGNCTLHRLEGLVEEEALASLQVLSGGTLLCQVRRVLEQGDIAAARILFCELASAGESVQVKAAIRKLTKGLPAEAIAGLVTGDLTEADIDEVFSRKPDLTVYA